MFRFGASEAHKQRQRAFSAWMIAPPPARYWVAELGLTLGFTVIVHDFSRSSKLRKVEAALEQHSTILGCLHADTAHYHAARGAERDRLPN